MANTVAPNPDGVAASRDGKGERQSASVEAVAWAALWPSAVPPALRPPGLAWVRRCGVPVGPRPSIRWPNP